MSYEGAIRSSISTLRNTTNIGGHSEHRVLVNGLTDVDGAKSVARRLFDTYDIDRKTYINEQNVTQMIADVYSSFNRSFIPGSTDIKSYLQVLDRDRDGKISYNDLEEMCVRYLVAGYQPQKQQESVLVSSQYQVKQEPQITEQEKKSGKSNHHSNYGHTQNAPQFSTQRFTNQVLQQIEVARKIFNQYDGERPGYIATHDVVTAIQQSYSSIGLSAYLPSRESLQSIIDLYDNKSGLMQYDYFEKVLIKSLERNGIQIEQSPAVTNSTAIYSSSIKF